MKAAVSYIPARLTKVSSAKKLPVKKADLILKYTPLIRFIANRIAVRLPSHIDIEDMVNTGVLGLMDAIEKYDPERGVKFETYAEFRIKGAILDELRALDWVPRSVRKIATWVENTNTALEKKFGRPANDNELACAMDIEVDKLHEFISRTSGISLLSLEMVGKFKDSKRPLLDFLSDSVEKTPLEILKLDELRNHVANCIERLPEKEKLVISLYYYDELTMKDIGKVLNLTESRVSQIHTKAILRLKGKLKKILEDN
jgi:RNA polymerase sigma factor for flagellar operon FliA